MIFGYELDIISAILGTQESYTHPNNTRNKSKEVKMNRNFKVVFSEARETLMVVNELTSSVQAKGTKTVIAAAAAMVAGAACAGESAWVDIPTTGVTEVHATLHWASVDKQGLYHFNRQQDPMQFTILPNGRDAFTGKLWLSGEKGSQGLCAEGEGTVLSNKGDIFVNARTPKDYWDYTGMLANKSAKVINEGRIILKHGVGMNVGTSQGNKAAIENYGLIIVEGTGVGMELGGGGQANGSTGLNQGTIAIGDIEEGAVGYGVMIAGINDATFTNNGTISTGANGKAIVVHQSNQGTSAKIILAENSKIDGLIEIETHKDAQHRTRADIVADGMRGELDIDNEGDTTLTLQNGAVVTLTDGRGNTYESATIDRGTLNASIQKADNTFQTVTVGENGVFNITKLNSGGDRDNLEAQPHDTLLLSRNQTFTFNGSKLHVDGRVFTGKLTVGQLAKDDAYKGSVTLNGGSHAFEYLTIGSDSSLTIAKNGQLTLGTLHLYQKGSGNEGGKLIVQNAALTVDALTFETDAKGIALENGTLATGHANLFDGKDLTAQAELISGSGVIDAFDWQGDYTLDDIKNAQAKFNSTTGNKIQVTFSHGNLTSTDLTAEKVQGLVLADSTGKATGGSFSVNSDSNTTLAAIDFGNAESAKLKAEGGGALILSGNKGNIFENLKGDTVTVESGTLQLGVDQQSAGVVNAGTLAAKTLNVAGDFEANEITADAATIDGTLSLNRLSATEGTVNGKLILNGAADDASELLGKISVKGGGLLATNKTAADAYVASLVEEEPSAVLYADRSVKLEDSAEVVIGKTTDQHALLANGDNASVTVLEGGVAVVDVTGFLGKEATVFGDNADVIVDGGDLNLVNVKKTGEVKLGASAAVNDGSELRTDNPYLDASAKTGGTVAVIYRDGILAEEKVDARLKALFAEAPSAKQQAILNALASDVYLDADTQTFNELGNKAFKQAAGGNAAAGVLNVAYDANALVTDAIVRHQLANHGAAGVWADVLYAKNEAKDIYGGSGYSADITGGMLGFDAAFSCGTTAGLTLAMGKADADSEGGVLANSLNSDFWGVSLHASKDFSGLNVKADLGYLDFSNDFSGLGDASDASTITFGLRGDFTAYRNGAFSIAPHFGLRYTRIDTDATVFNDEQNMNVLEAPIGLKFAGTFEASGWKLVPSYDFAIVPQLGDKEVQAFGSAGDVTILESSLVNNVFGIEAAKGNLSFGLNAVYGLGAHDRANTQLNVDLRYRF